MLLNAINTIAYHQGQGNSTFLHSSSTMLKVRNMLLLLIQIKIEWIDIINTACLEIISFFNKIAHSHQSTFIINHHVVGALESTTTLFVCRYQNLDFGEFAASITIIGNQV